MQDGRGFQWHVSRTVNGPFIVPLYQDCVPSTCEHDRASLRTSLWRKSGVDGRIVVTPSRRPTAATARSDSLMKRPGSSGGAADFSPPVTRANL